jgi:DNA-binding response OmpR family regulator
MTKPYSLKELSARIRAQLRRGEIIQRHHYGNENGNGNGSFYIDPHNRMIHAGGKNVFLSEKEFDLFMLFYENPMKVFSNDEIFEKIWQNAKPNQNTVAVHILKLRRKLDEAATGRIENNYGTGYRFIPPGSGTGGAV